MSQIKREIIQHMLDLKKTESEDLVAHFVFPNDFIGFKGHFPLKKILPGVCQIQCIVVMLEQWKERKVLLKEIVQAKFLSPISPSEEITCICKNINTINEGEAVILKTSIHSKTEKVAEFKLKVNLCG